MKKFNKKPKLHDGYIMVDGLIQFYRDSAYNKVMSHEVFKVDEDKVVVYEEMWDTYHKNFMKLGLLRLHTPTNVHEERSGANFLYVSPKERARIKEMIGDGTLITLDNFNTFCVIESGKCLTLKELTGLEISGISEISRENLLMQTVEGQAQVNLQDRFFTGALEIEGMFVQKGKTRLEKFFG